MPIRLDHLAVQEARTTVEFGGERATVVFRPHLITGDVVQSMSAQAKSDGTQAGEQMAVLSQFLADAIVEWDIMNGDTPIPITKETFLRLPVSLLNVIVEAIFSEMQPGKTKPATSHAFSQRTAELALPPRGSS